MRAVVQRVAEASVEVGGEIVAEIGAGVLVLLGVTHGDTMREVAWLARKVAGLRIFQDDEERMNRSLNDIRGEVIVVSQFTLHADTRKGHRPSFIEAAPPEQAIPLYEAFVAALKEILGSDRVGCGVFGASMQVRLNNSGPVTIIIDTPTASRK